MKTIIKLKKNLRTFFSIGILTCIMTITSIITFISLSGVNFNDFLLITRYELELFNVNLIRNLVDTGSPEFIHDVIAFLFKDSEGSGTPQFIGDFISMFLKDSEGPGTPQFIGDFISMFLKDSEGPGTPQMIREIFAF